MTCAPRSCGALYGPGRVYPPERHIAETYGVSRTIVREALLVLELQGTVDIRQGSGVYVLAHSPRNDSEENAARQRRRPV